MTKEELYNAIRDVSHDVESGLDVRARQKLAALSRDLATGQLESTPKTEMPEDVQAASARYGDSQLAIVDPEMARSRYSRTTKTSQIRFCSADLEKAFEKGFSYSQERLWHPGTEKPEVEDGSGRLFVVIPSVTCDMDAFFCYYNNGEKEPWSAVALPSDDPYHLTLSHDEVERWADFDDLMNIKREK